MRKAGTCVPLVWGAILLALAPSAALADEPDPAASMYEPDSIVAIDLTLPQASIEALEDDPTEEYQPGTFSLATTDGTPQGIGEFSAPIEVGIRLKGKAGSFKPLGQKAAFKVKISHVKGQKFLGLKKMTLNNMVQDPSMVHETLSYEAFRAMGVLGPRTGYAFVRLNGEALGVYLNVEDLDDVGLEKRFGAFDDPQHLYEGEYGTDLTAADVEDFEVDEGDDEDLGDLEALVTAVNDELAPDWSERVDPHADLVQMTRMWAVEKYVGHWDGYAGKVDDDEHDLPNNYYLYSDPLGRFQMLPWGTDQTWAMRVPFGGGGGILIERCLDDAGCAELFEGAATAALDSIPALDLGELARCTAQLLAPWQALEQAAIRPYGAGEIAAALAATREFVATRPGELAEWLGVDAPDPPIEKLACDQPPPPDPPSSQPPVQSASLLPLGKPVRASHRSPRVRLVGPVHQDGRLLSLRAKLSGPGWVRLDATLGYEPSTHPACAGVRRARPAGPTWISCRISRAVWRRLESRALGMTLTATFETRSGEHAEGIRILEVRRR